MSKAPVVLPRVGPALCSLLKATGGKGQQERSAGFFFAEALAPASEGADAPAVSQRSVPPAPLAMLSAEMMAAAALAPISATPCEAPKVMERQSAVAHDDRPPPEGSAAPVPRTMQSAAPPVPRTFSARCSTPEEDVDTRATEEAPVSAVSELQDFALPDSRPSPDAPPPQIVSLSTHHAPITQSLAPRLAEVVGAVAKDMATKDDVRPDADASVRPTVRPGASSIRTIVVQLSPAELGAMKVSVRATGATASVEIAVSEHNTVNAVRAARESIVEAVRDAGFDAASVAVAYAASPPASPGAAQFSEGNWHGENHEGRRKRDDKRERSRARSSEEPRVGASASRVI